MFLKISLALSVFKHAPEAAFSLRYRHLGILLLQDHIIYFIYHLSIVIDKMIDNIFLTLQHVEQLVANMIPLETCF